MIASGALVNLLRAGLVDELGEGRHATRALAAFDRAASQVLGRLVDGVGYPMDKAEALVKRKRKAAVNGEAADSEASQAEA